jgi:hypothetical protein
VAGVQQQLHPMTTKGKNMKTYTVLFAEDVPHYGTAEIEAHDDAAALQAAKAYPLSDVTNDGEWENSACKRVVWIEDAEGNTIAEDISLDDCFLRHGGDKERALCDAAAAMLDALEALTCSLSPRKIIPVLKAAGYATDTFKAAHRNALSAIAKAKGGAL